MKGVRADWILDALVYAALVALMVPTFADPDLWGHLRFGLDVLATHTVPYVDRYTFAQGRPWINHEWLSEAQMALAFKGGGVTGLLMLKLLLGAIALWALYGALARVPVLARCACMVLAVWAALPLATTLRPQLWTWLFTIVIARLFLGPPTRRLVVLPGLVFAAWMNAHGGVVVGAALLMIWAAFHLWTAPGTRRLVAATLLVSAIGALCNPYGLRLWEFLLESVRLGRDIREWRSIWQAPFITYQLPWLLTAAAVIGVSLTRARVRVDRLVALALFAYVSQRTMRLVPLFAAIGVIYLAPSIESLAASGWLSWRLRAPSRAAAALGAVPLAAFAAFVWSGPWASARACMPIEGDWAPDLKVAAALRAAAPDGRLVTTFAWSQYSIWHFGPALRVSFDGRLETLYTDATDVIHTAIARGEADGLTYLADTRPDYVWLAESSAITREWLRQRPDYRIDMETPESFLAVRSDRPVVRPVADVPRACFPG
jgi:hypothetical protein